MTNRMWTVMLALAAMLCAQSLPAQEEVPREETHSVREADVAKAYFGNDEALADYQAWVRDEERIRSVLEGKGFDFSGDTQSWYKEAIAPALAEKSGDWYTLRIGFRPLTPDAAANRWAPIRDAYRDHLDERIRAMTEETTAELQAQIIAIGDQRDEYMERIKEIEADYTADSLKAAVDKARDTQVQIDLELAGLGARLDAIREALAREEAAMEQTVKDRLPLLDLQRQAARKRVELVERGLSEAKAAVESGRSPESDLTRSEHELLLVQTEFIELEAKGNEAEITPVHTRLREMLVEAEIAHAEHAARKKIADDHFTLVAERLERYKGLGAELNRLRGEEDAIRNSMIAVTREVREKVVSAYGGFGF